MADTESPLTSFVQQTLGQYLRRYHRHEIQVDAEIPEPALLVCNHGFGGLVDLNALALFAKPPALRLRRPTTALVHQVAWTLGAGKIAEAMGGRPASRETADDELAAGHNVVVFPGGDIDAFKAWRDRNRVVFGGRTGFARLAMKHSVPVVPIVTAGAGESVFVITAGQRVARALRLNRLLRLNALPVNLSIPWGLNIGVAGMLPYLPLPTKLVTVVMAPMRPEPGESAEDFAARVEAAMQARLDQITANRKPILG